MQRYLLLCAPLLVVACGSEAGSISSRAGANFEASSGTRQTISVDAMTHSVGADNGDGSWNIWSNGDVSTPITFATGGTYTIGVDAKGGYAGNLWPTMQLQIDGNVAGSTTVASATTAHYAFSVTVTEGRHNVAVAFVNDYWDGVNDRNLYVTDVTIDPPQDPAMTTRKTILVASMTHTVGADNGDGSWNIYSNGDVDTTFTFPVDGTYAIGVDAKGTYAGSAWPSMQLLIDDVVKGAIAVDSATATHYAFSAALTAGNHKIAVAFTNDFWDGTNDRNLYVYDVTIDAPSTTPVPPPPTPVTLISPAYFVSPAGNDNNDGKSASSPFLTLERAANAMRASDAPKTTYVMGGTFYRTTPLALTSYLDAHTSWIGYPGQTPVLDGNGVEAHAIDVTSSYVSISGLTIQNFQSGIFALWSDHVTVQGNTLNSIRSPDWRTNILGSSIFFLKVSDSSIIGNVVNGNTATGIQVNGGGQGDVNSNVIVSGNVVNNTCSVVNDCGAIYFRDLGHVSTGQIISGNTITTFHTNAIDESVGIYLDDEASNVTVTGNTVGGIGQYAILIHGGDHNVIQNNNFDLDSNHALGLYQDDETAGGPNYGMAGNVFTGNTISAPPSMSVLWDFLDGSRAGITKPAVYGNTYIVSNTNVPRNGPIVDTAPSFR